MANYTIDDIQNALQQNLISEEDAQYLAQELEPGAPVGGMVGGALGAAGLGAVGAALGGGAGQKLASRYAGVADGAGKLGGLAKKTANAMDAPMSPLGAGPGTGSFTAAEGLGAAAGAGMGGLAGASAGNMMLPPSEGEGVQGMGTLVHNKTTGERSMGLDRDMALRMLMSEEVPAAQKQKIMQMLQEMDAQMPPEAAGGGGMGPMGAALAGGAGMLAGGAAGARGAKMLAGLGGEGAGKMGQMAGSVGKAMGPMNNKVPGSEAINDLFGGTGGLVGAGAGNIAGLMGGAAMSGGPDPSDELAAYAEPF